MLHQNIGPKDVIDILRRRWLLICMFIICGGVAGYLTSRILPKRFTSKTLVLVQQPSVSSQVVTTVVSDNSNQRLAAMQQEILSRSRLEPVIQQLHLYANDIATVPMENLVDRLRKAVTVTPIQPMAETRAQNLPGFTISVVFGDAQSAQQICAKITSMFMSENLQIRTGEAKETTRFLDQQVADAKAKLDEQDAKLADFQRRYLGSLPDENQTNLSLLTGLNSQLEASTQALSRAQQDKSFAESILAQQLAVWHASQNGQNPDSLEKQLAALQAQLVDLRSKYTDDYPDVIKAKNDIALLQQRIARNQSQKNKTVSNKALQIADEPAQIVQLRAQIHQYDQVIQERTRQQAEIQKQIGVYQARVQATPAVEQQYKLLTRDHDVVQASYNDLLKKRDQSAMSQDLEESQNGERFQVLDPANLPDTPSFPNPLLFTGGGLALGLALGVGLILLLEMQDTSMRFERDVEAALQLPVLAMIPVISQNSQAGKAQLNLSKSISGKAELKA